MKTALIATAVLALGITSCHSNRLPQQTVLTAVETIRFDQWTAANHIRMDDGWNEDYDMRGLWKADPNAKPDSHDHYPDTYKLPNHPTFSQESVYATADAPVWHGCRLIDSTGRVVADECNGLVQAYTHNK